MSVTAFKAFLMLNLTAGLADMIINEDNILNFVEIKKGRKAAENV